MKFNCGPTWSEKIAAKEQWHPWFAWYPVRLETNNCVWLETLQRRGVFNYYPPDMYWTWEYKANE